MKLGYRHGRDRKPYSRRVYAGSTIFWTVATGLYANGAFQDHGAYDLTGDPMGYGWTIFFLIVSAFYMVTSARIWLQYPGRVVEWATTVRNQNAACRALHTPKEK